MMTLLAMPLVTKVGYLAGMVDQPDDRKVHTKAMPRSGGIAIALGVFFTILCFDSYDRGVQAMMLGALIIVITGLCDDVLHIRPWQKFLGEILAAIVFIWWSGVSLHTLGNLLASGPLQTGSFASVVTVIGIVGLINALNLSDGLDGLAGGLSAIACLFMGFFAYVSQQWACLYIVVVLFGSLLGFLYYNSHPARVFMGDTGSLLLGYLLSTAAVLMAGKAEHPIAPISMALVLALPIFDTLLVMTRRMVLGYSPFTPDKTHLHHRLLHLGLPHGAVVSMLYCTMGLFGMAAVLLRFQPEWMQFAAGITMALLIYGTVIGLNRSGYRWQGMPIDADEHQDGLPHAAMFQLITAWSGRSIIWLTWLIPLLLIVPVCLLNALPTKVEWLLILSVGGLMVLYPLRSSEDRLGIVHGLLYWCIFLLLAIFSYYGNELVHHYLAALAMVIAIWVSVKLVFKRNRRVFLTSGFEVLVILVSWLLPYLFMDAAYLSEDGRQRLIIACLESIPFLLAMKIIIRRQPRRNRALMLSLSAVLLILAVTGIG